jgi:hypothetical protein
MQTGYLDTIIKIELVILLAHRNSGLNRSGFAGGSKP